MKRNNQQGESNRKQHGRRAIACVLLSGSLLAGNVLPSVAAERPILPHAAPSSQPPSERERSSDNAVLWGIGAVVAGVAACAFLGCFGGDEEPAATSGGGSNLRNYDNSGKSDDDYMETEDTSAGCAWGDRAYGTCH